MNEQELNRGSIGRAADFLEQYAAYIHRVKPEDIEQHPYLPELEEVAADLRAAAPSVSLPVADCGVEAGERLTRAAKDVLAERARQINVEGWTPEHDDEHGNGELAFAAACYAQQASGRAWMFGSLGDAAERYARDDPPDNWPDSWDTSWWRPKNPRRDLVRAAALILAEIERMDRAAPKDSGAPHEEGGVVTGGEGGNHG